jgi:hypothetical protein
MPHRANLNYYKPYHYSAQTDLLSHLLSGRRGHRRRRRGEEPGGGGRLSTGQGERKEAWVLELLSFNLLKQLTVIHNEADDSEEVAAPTELSAVGDTSAVVGSIA